MDDPTESQQTETPEPSASSEAQPQSFPEDAQWDKPLPDVVLVANSQDYNPNVLPLTAKQPPSRGESDSDDNE